MYLGEKLRNLTVKLNLECCEILNEGTLNVCCMVFSISNMKKMFQTKVFWPPVR